MTKLGWPPQTRSGHLAQYVHMKIEVNWNTWRQVIKKSSHPWSQSYLAMPELGIHRSLNNIVPFNVVSLQNWWERKEEEKKKTSPSRTATWSWHTLAMSAWVFSGHPSYSHIPTTYKRGEQDCLHRPGLSVFECECAHTRTRTHPEGRASCLGLVPTSHPKLPG